MSDITLIQQLDNDPCGSIFVPHVSGCIRRSLQELTCVENVQTFFIPISEWGTISIDSNDGNGNYIITQTLTSTTGAAIYAAMIAAASTSNTRISENINGSFTINFWNGNIGNVTQISPTSFQYEYFIEPGVTDIPSVLPSPCIDPIENQIYIDNAALLRTAFDSYGIGNPSPNGADITFTITTYSTNTIIGNNIEILPAKQIVSKKSDGSYEERFYTPGDINTEIIFNTLTDIFSTTNCEPCKKEIFATHIKYYHTTNTVNIFDQDGDVVDETIFNNTYLSAINGVNEGYYVGLDANNKYILLSQITTPIFADFQDALNFVNSLLPLVEGIGVLLSSTISGSNGVFFIFEDKCYEVQEIKEKDSCTGEETYRYVVEDSTGQLLDASVSIANFSEANVKLECPTVVTPTIEYIPHVSGCIKRKNGTVEATCKSTNTTYNFSDTDMVGFTITANDGNGNYTIIQEQSNTIAHNKFLTLLQNVSQPNARILEDVGPGFTTFHMWTGNVTNVTSISPLEVQFDFHVEAGVSDTPTPLVSPCVDPVPDATYQADAVALRGIYDPVPLNTQQPNGGTALIFTVTNYSLEYNITGGTEDFIPAKQIVYKDIDGSFVEEYRTVGDINTLIQFNPITDSFSVNCEQTTTTASSAIYEKEVCGTIDGSVDSFELIKVYTRDATTGNITLLHYESNTGAILTGDIVEVCCTCDSLCDVPTSVTNKVAFGYATLFNGSWVAGDRITGGEELYLDYLEVDGNILVNSPRTLGSTTGGFTATDMGYGIGYNKIVDLLNTVPEFAANGVRFVTAAAPFAPNGTSYDPMMWGVEYDDTKDVRIVLRDKLLISGSSHSYSIRLNPDPAQTYDALMNVVTSAANDWDINNVSNYTSPMLLQNITAI